MVSVNASHICGFLVLAKKISVCAKPLGFIWFGWLTLCLQKFSHFKVLKVESDFCSVALGVDRLTC